MSGITVLKNSSVIPKEVILKGNFGRNFKILSSTANSFAFGIEAGRLDIGTQKFGISVKYPEFSVAVKTGYGSTKILQNILNKSNDLSSNGEIRQLYFYNLALGESYLVTTQPNGNSYSQSQDMNMIWQYSVNLSVLARLEDFKGITNKKSKS